MTANVDGYFGKGPGAMSSASADVEIASGMLGRLEDREAARKGRPVAEVRPVIARRISSTPGTLANIRRQRRKSIPAWLFASIRKALIETLQAEIVEIEHEIAIARQTGLDPRADAFCEAETALVHAREVLEGAAGS